MLCRPCGLHGARMPLALDASHDLYQGARSGIAIAADADAVVQGIRTRLLLFRGEWFLDVNAGTPWFEEVLTDGQDIRRIESALKTQILATPGVESILSFDLNFDRATRDLSVTFEVDTIYGPSGVIEVSP